MNDGDTLPVYVLVGVPIEVLIKFVWPCSLSWQDYRWGDSHIEPMARVYRV